MHKAQFNSKLFIVTDSPELSGHDKPSGVSTGQESARLEPRNHLNNGELGKGYSPETHTLIRVPGPDYVMKDNLADYAVEASMKIIDGFSKVS